MENPKPRILVLDDEETVRFALREYLTVKGFDVLEASTCEKARCILLSEYLDAVVLDYSLPDGNAIKLLTDLKNQDALVPSIILTAHGSIDLAVSAIKEGAEQFLTKPVDLSTLCVLLKRILENQRNRQHQAQTMRSTREALNPFLGSSRLIREVEEQCSRVVNSDVPVLLSGETGCGKGVIASWLHRHGPRGEGPFVDVNCAGLSQELLESELFGHEKGAFTGAFSAKVGLVEVAHRGTLFLDEIGDMHALVQPKLLTVLQEKQYRRVGDVRNRSANFRAVSATHRNLSAYVQEERFRADLFFRINTVEIHVPSLRERIEDLPILARAVLNHIAMEIGRKQLELSSEALVRLAEYHWPGNIRELRNVLERSVLLSGHSVLGRADITLQASAIQHSDGLDVTLESAEKLHIRKILEIAKGNVPEAARLLGIAKSTLYAKLQAYDLKVQES